MEYGKCIVVEDNRISHLLYIPPTLVGGLLEDGIRKTLYFNRWLKPAVFNVFLDNDSFRSQTKKFILRILNEEFHLDKIKRPDLDDIGGVYQKSGSNFWVAVEGDKIVGSVAVMNYGNRRGYLKRMYVDKKYRGSGLAKRLLDTVLTYAKTLGITEIFLGTIEGMIAANNFYKKNGFERIRKLPPGLPDFGDTIFYKLEL